MMRLRTALLAAGGVAAASWLVGRLQTALSGFDYRGRVCVVTGGSRGLGLVLARGLTRRGAKVAICARNADDLRRAALDLERSGAQVMAHPCDVTDADDVNAFFRAVETQLGPVDVLIHNAGTISVGPIETMTRADYEQALGVHYWGAYHCVEAVRPSMQQRSQGRIVLISSIGGKIAIPHLVPYSASKFALVGYGAGLRAELAKDGITVTTVCPGLMRTGSPRNALFKGQHEKEYAWFKLGDSLPFLSTSAESAARQVLEACQCGDAEIVLTLPAKAAVLAFNLFPNLTARLLELTDRLLPAPAEGTQAWLGKDSESPLAPGLVTALTDRAARQNNEVAPGEIRD